jgi:hypothetical protein
MFIPWDPEMAAQVAYSPLGGCQVRVFLEGPELAFSNLY